MTDREAPRLETRRADEFRAELTERARAWIRDWNIDEGGGGFGAALIGVAASFSAQVAQRLDRAGEKLSLGLLDWLALRRKAARPARMPVAFRLADNAVEAVLAPHPIRLQADVDGASVVFETDTDVRLVPGRLALLVGVDASRDQYFLPPGELSSLDPVGPLPTQWHTKAFAQLGATHIQLDPPIGVEPAMLLDIAGRQYRADSVEGDLVGLDPAVDAPGGLAPKTEVNKVASFDPFGAAARNRQRHYVYLGDDDLFNIDAAADFEIHGADTRLSTATWEYFGKKVGDDTARWRALEFGPANTQGAGKLTLHKPAGSVEPTQVGRAGSTRWIRAGQERLEGAGDILTTEALKVVVNPGAATLNCPARGADGKPGAEAGAEGFANTTPLAFTSAFYPLGREPKQFDTFYLGCVDAFSKKGADVAICFEMSDAAAHAFAAMREGLFANRVLASIGGDGALHLLQVDAATGTLSRFLHHEPLQPPSDSGAALALDPQPAYRPPMWAVNDEDTVSDASSGTSPFGTGVLGILGASRSNPFYVAAAAGISVWVRKEYPSSVAASDWFFFGNVPAPAGANRIDGLVYLRNGDDVAASLLFAACGGKLFSHSAVWRRAKEPWAPVPLTNVPVSAADPYKLVVLAPIDRMPGPRRWHGSIADGMVGIFSNTTESLVYFVEHDGTCTALDDTLPAAKGTQPAAAHIGSAFYVFWQLVSPAPVAPATAPSVLLHVAKVDETNRSNHIDDDDTVPGADGPEAIGGGLLEIPPSDTEASVLATGTRDNESWILNWVPFGGASPKYFETRLPDGAGPLGGAPTLLDRFIVVPGTQSDAWSASWDASLRRDFDVTLESGVVVPTTLAPAILRHDYIAIETTGTNLEKSEVTDLDHTLGTDRFHSLHDEFGLGSVNSQLVIYRHASAAGLNGAQVAGNRMTRDPADVDTQAHDWLLVTGASYLQFRRVLQINAGSEIQFYASPNALPNGALTYWRPERLPGRAAPFMRLDPNAEGAWDARLLDQVRLNFTQRDPGTQGARAFSTTPAGRPTLVVLDAPWNATTPLGNGASHCSFDGTLGLWSRQLNENTTNPTLIWEFWNGRGWDELTLSKDETQDFTVTGKLAFKVPPTLAPTDVSGKTSHWIRARLIQGDYGHEVVTVLTQPHPTIPGATVQEVRRDASDFHPPLVVNMRIRYSVGASLPTYLLTQDGGSLRDQSDANRTPGAFVEAFTPLAVQLGRLETAGAEIQTAACAPTCDCNGPPGAGEPMAPAVAAALGGDAPPPATTVPLSLMLGFSGDLIGEPVNVLLLVEERAHDGFAPLKVEALVNDRFESVAVRDTTRALGESGLLSMSFPVKPSPRELFGQSLTWLRLSPSRASPDATWKPVIRGAYLNAAWATAAETLTREPLGSSDGRPHLAVQVARPPLLQDTLELRVREPLDDEERKQLLDQHASNVKSNEPDLKGDWVLWKQVPDPDDAGPRERVYSLDEPSGEIRFGDGLHGMIPPIGRDAIVAFSYRRTEPAADSGDSVPANGVAARTALQLVTPVESVEAAFAADRAAGGSPPEAAERVLRFGNSRLRHRERAVSASDFEDLAMQSSPDIAQARAFRTAQGLKLVVVMRGPQPAPDAAQRRELQRLLQAAASPLLGGHDAVTIAAPRVRRLRLKLALRVASLEDAGRVGGDARQSVVRLFDTATGGVSGSGWPLGAAPTEEDVAFALGSAHDLAGIDEIEMVGIDKQGNELPWRAALRPDELVMLADDALRIRFEPLELPA